MLPILDTDTPRRPLPLVTISLICLNCIAFLYQLHNAGPGLLIGLHNADAGVTFLHWGLVPRDIPGSWISTVSYSFLHLHPLHLASNMLFLWVFAPMVEHRAGPLALTTLYLATAAAAAAAHVAAFPESHQPLAGASGAVSGVLAACLLTSPTNRIRCVTPALTYVHPRTVWILAVWFALLFAQALLYLQLDGTQAASMPAHLGGAAAGLLIAATARFITGRPVIPTDPHQLS